MSAVNPVPDSALHAIAELGDDTDEPALPTQPWHAPPTFGGTWGTFEGENEPEFELEARVPGQQEAHAESFDLHDTIPAPPWLDEPGDGLEIPVFRGR